MLLTLPKTTLNLSIKTRIMGILNLTPDSFSDGGKFKNTDNALFHAENMVKAGADIIDVGGESTRPNSKPITADEELDRVIPIIEKLNSICPIISIDTVKSKVADEALKSGAQIINDISGLQFDSTMATIASEYKAAVILMHIQGKPQTMQQNPTYKNLIEDVKSYLKISTEIAEKAGIQKDQIIIDPGIGFGKTVRDNLTLIRELRSFKEFGFPIIVGVSRKSFIGNINKTEISDRLIGSLAALSASVMTGANIVRVHDVKESRLALEIVDSIRRGNNV